jgi:hypothetical protein
LATGYIVVDSPPVWGSYCQAAPPEFDPPETFATGDIIVITKNTAGINAFDVGDMAILVDDYFEVHGFRLRKADFSGFKNENTEGTWTVCNNDNSYTSYRYRHATNREIEERLGRVNDGETTIP